MAVDAMDTASCDETEENHCAPNGDNRVCVPATVTACDVGARIQLSMFRMGEFCR